MGNAEPAATTGQPALLKIEQIGSVLTVGLNRPAKRNALNDGIILAIQDCFSDIPDGIGAVVIHGIGDHFSSGLDLSGLIPEQPEGVVRPNQLIGAGIPLPSPDLANLLDRVPQSSALECRPEYGRDLEVWAADPIRHTDLST